MSTLQELPRIAPFLWFDSNSEEAVDFYLNVFKNSRRLGEFRKADDIAGLKGSVLTFSLELDGRKFTALNGGPVFEFNEAVSFVVRCDSLEEVDYYWSKLTAGGAEIEGGSLKDKFGFGGKSCLRACPTRSRIPRRCRP
jgi:predicted 3-demethylubiquinone-9 3-methyltransferase (glyoxalase superfamily)